MNFIRNKVEEKWQILIEACARGWLVFHKYICSVITYHSLHIYYTCQNSMLSSFCSGSYAFYSSENVRLLDDCCMIQNCQNLTPAMLKMIVSFLLHCLVKTLNLFGFLLKTKCMWLCDVVLCYITIYLV
jgi:hypothetical protein